MSETESLRMAAEIVDKFSKPLSDLKRSLRSMAADSKVAHQLGQVQAKSHTESLLALRRQVTDVADRVKGSLSPALGSLGVTSLSAAGGIAAIALAMKEFAGSARHLTFLSRQTQLSVEQLRVLEALAPRIGSSVEEMDSALVTFNEHMEKLRRTPLGVLRETFEALHVRPDPGVISGWTNLISSLQGLPRAEQLSKIVDYLSKIRDISQKGVVLEAFGLPKAFANLSPKELQEQLDRIKQILTPMSPEAVAGGVAFAHAMDDVALALKNLRDVLGADLAKDLRGVADGITEFTTAHSKDMVAGLREMIGAAKEFVTGIAVMKNALDAFREEKPIDWATVLNVAGLGGTFELFKATWKANWEQFKGSIGLGDKGATDAAEAERKRLLKEKSPEQFEREEKERRDELEKGPKGGLPFAPRWPVPQISPEREMQPAPEQPLWKRLFHLGENESASGIKPAGFEVPDDWRGALKSPGAGADRGLESIIERGTLAALRDFAAEQKGDTGGGGGGAGGAMSAIRANYSPGGGMGPGGAGAGTGEPSAGGGAGVGGGPASEPMGTLGGKPQGVTNIGGADGAGAGASGGAMRLMRGLVQRGWSPEAAAMMAGNVKAESNFKTGEVGDHGTSFGLAQWHNERARALMGAAKAQGKDWKDFDFQTDFLDKEFRGRFGDKAVASHDFGALSQMGKRFEGYSTNTYGARVAAGQRYLRDFSAGGGEAGKPPHFNVADIRKSLEGTAASPLPGAMLAATGKPPEAFIMHHTGGRGTIAGLQNTLRQRGLGVEYAMDREGNISVIGKPGAANILPGWGKGAGLNNKNIVGMEVIARNNKDVTKAQIESSARFAREVYPTTPFYGHGEVNPGHKEADEGMAEVNAIRAERERAAAGGGGLHGAALRSHFGHRAHPDLLGSARQSGLVGAPLNHKVTGNASVDINLAGFPRGTTSKVSADGMFKTVKLNRGRAMPPANQEG
jgi:hypothetical protein